MKLNKKFLTTLLIVMLFFVLTNEISSHSVSHPPHSSNWRYSDYHLDHGNTGVRSFRYLDGTPSIYRNITESAIDRWNSQLNSITLTENSNANNWIRRYSTTSDNAFAVYVVDTNIDQHVYRWNISYNDAKMGNLIRNDQNAIAKHEFGHVLGLDHIYNSYQIMRHDPTTFGIKRPSVDEVNAANHINY